mmetsp:Transcript_30520/g.68909  ORF Transcript_30520/g.68909 Transcript_30520/m.68909 type:complete len:105 (-) Transcript_30520:125-439(-)
MNFRNWSSAAADATGTGPSFSSTLRVSAKNSAAFSLDLSDTKASQFSECSVLRYCMKENRLVFPEIAQITVVCFVVWRLNDLFHILLHFVIQIFEIVSLSVDTD